jgi:phosphopentomutase
VWDIRRYLIVMTSDHGNLEDLQVRGHTRNPVPALVIGPHPARREFLDGLNDLTDFAPAILRALERD